jgi:quinol-cytochrome oxidoreductase complex cytochrome b subunit
MIVPMVRDEEDLEDLYTDDFFWLHERGVDLLFIFVYLHLFRKLYIHTFEYEHELTWKSGIFTFLIFQAVVFCGLVLCCTHLSEITLTIAANIVHTFFGFYGKPYWWFFTDQQLNSDTLIRLAYIHYIIAFYMLYLGVLHAFDMHYDWKTESVFDAIDIEMVWWDEALSSELSSTIDCLVVIALICWYLYPDNEALSYEIFMWGDIGLISDVRYYGVAPHWYFRPFMAWLVVCPHHKTGVFGLIFFFWILFQQPILHGIPENTLVSKQKNIFTIFFRFNRFNYFNFLLKISAEANIYHQGLYWFFIMCVLYTTTFLPYGRFYNRLGGNIGMLGAYFFIFCWLAFKNLRHPFIIDFKKYHFYWFAGFVYL